MRNLILAAATTLFLLGCSDKSENSADLAPQLVKGKSLQELSLNDQFEKPQALTADTKKVIFAFTKDTGHLGNDFFATQDPDYLPQRDALFIADISQAPSLIRSMFVLPGLKELKHSVMLIMEDSDSAKYQAQVDSENILIVDVDTFVITGISYVGTEKELKEALQ